MRAGDHPTARAAGVTWRRGAGAGRARRALVVGLVLALASVVLAGCGEATLERRDAARVYVTISDSDLTPRRVELEAPGVVLFVARNNGRRPHALRVRGQGVDDRTDEFRVGRGATLRVELPRPGTYEMLCPLADDAEDGEQGEVIVGEAGGSD